MHADAISPALADDDGPGGAPAGGMSRLRLLCIASHEPAWTNLALQLDAAGCHEPRFRWVATSSAALTALRNESFDCILIGAASGGGTAGAGDFEPLIDAIRASGQSEPILLLVSRADDRLLAAACRTDCDVLPAPDPWESQALVPMIRRALARAELSRENHRLSVAHRRRLVHERDEAEHLLRQQREIIQELSGLMDSHEEHGEPHRDPSPLATRVPGTTRIAAAADRRLPAEFDGYYHELLRTYVIMGSGNLGPEIGRVAELLALAGLSPTEALELHLAALETLVNGLGNRSTRHVMARADLLALELMIHLGECYQKQAGAPRPPMHESFGGLAETARRLRNTARNQSND
ncbi:MAG: hypothetical protein WD069_10030 [Planctomycetales bacterium]